MAWIYFQESVASQSPSVLGSRPSPIASVSDTHRPSYCLECNRVTLTMLPFGTTCAHCPQTTSLKWTSSQADSPARISALQEMEQAWEASEADLCLKSLGSFASADLDSFSWKTSQLSLFGGLTEFCWSSMRWGLMRAGQLFQPQKWEPRTYENESGYWPTPAAMEGRGSAEAIMARRERNGFRNMDGLTTADAVRIWDSPGNLKRSLWTTPCADDTGHRKAKYAQGGTALSTQAGGQLNPTWVEWLMGYPLDWTELEGWAMQWFRPQREKRSCA